jgi:hypothetical protein
VALKKQKMKKISTLVAGFILAGFGAGLAQSNLGADCGCPPVASRPTVNLGDAAYSVQSGASEGDLIATNTILTCDKNWRLPKKIYVPAGKSITIQPGTVIKGDDLNAPGAGAASALIVCRDAKIFASGTSTCPIVFTTGGVNGAGGDALDGTYPLSNRGRWGGLVILGRATNNLVSPTNNSGIGIAGISGVGFIEGYGSADTRIYHGGNAAQGQGPVDDNDNSGILRYVSIRHAGDIIVAGNELNGLTLGSVGRGTQIDHVEVISCDDDAFEMFGGTVNLKYCAALYGGDDMFDWDLGWSGNTQFFFGMHADSVTTPMADNGIEADGDDQKSNALPRSHPKIYNSTFIGNGRKLVPSAGNQGSDNTGNCGAKMKEITEGEIYNCIFAKFFRGVDFIKNLGTRTGTIEAYHNWVNGQTILSNNTFVACGAGTGGALTVGNSTANVIAADNTLFSSGNNTSVASVPGMDLTYNINFSTNSVVGNDKFTVVPSSNLSTTASVPVNSGFFTPANYRGAFEAGKKSWLSDWSLLNVISFTPGLVACPTDINQDGITNNTDFLQLLGQFNQSCQ